MDHRPDLRRAFSLIELLLVLAISAMLLTATGSALMTAANSARTNDGYARSRQNATNALTYILTRVRRAKEISFLPATPPYTAIITLDQGTWVDAMNDYDPDTCNWTQIALNGQKLRIGTGASASPAMQNVMDNVQSMAITATPDQYGVYHAVTVQLTIATPDAFSGANTSSFAVSGTTMCRSEGPTTAPAH